jgi:Dyp-type peroxidase family
LGRNGSYLVFRKLAQDVAGLRRYLRAHSRGEGEAEILGAKLVGRWADGTPLALSDVPDPQLSTATDFGYAELDPHGLRCPLGAHVRRANPRDALTRDAVASMRIVNRHRLLRRGVLYGPRLADGTVEDDGIDRGLLFLCINADIERQFEFVQQTWINNAKFGGLYDSPDPIAGSGGGVMTIPQPQLRRRLTGMPRFVRMLGGGYFFLPSRSALRYLAAELKIP